MTRPGKRQFGLKSLLLLTTAIAMVACFLANGGFFGLRVLGTVIIIALLSAVDVIVVVAIVFWAAVLACLFFAAFRFTGWFFRKTKLFGESSVRPHIDSQPSQEQSSDGT